MTVNERVFELVVMYLFLQKTVGSGECLPPYIVKMGHCILENDQQRFTYCEAQDYCHSQGGEVITGPKIKDFFGVYTDLHWVGMTDLLDETKKLPKEKQLFRYTDGSIAPRNMFTKKEPSNWSFFSREFDHQDCAIIGHTNKTKVVRFNEVYDYRCSSRNVLTICQPKGINVTANGLKKFYAKTVVRQPKMIMPGTALHACITKRYSATKNDCVSSCFWSETCVTFYYKEPSSNLDEENCLMIRHTDATLTEKMERAYPFKYTMQQSPPMPNP